jgi:hypothetical protein
MAFDQSRSYHTHHGSSGHVSQGRFRSFSVQRDEHLLMGVALWGGHSGEALVIWYSFSLLIGTSPIRFIINWQERPEVTVFGGSSFHVISDVPSTD